MGEDQELELLHPVCTPSEVASYLGYLLRRIRLIAAAASATTDPLIEDRTISDRSRLKEMAVLLLLAEEGPSSQQELAERLGINRSTMVKVVDELERERFVVRARDVRDRRRYALEVTEVGTEHAAALSAWAREVQALVLAPLQKARQARLVALLSALSAAHRPVLPPPLGDSLLWLVMAVHHDLETLGDEELAPFGLTIRSFVALAVLDGEACSQGGLAGLLSIGAPATVELVDQLEERGLLRRVRSVEDRRQYRLELSEAGRELHRSARAVVEVASAAFTAPIGDAAHEELLELLGAAARVSPQRVAG